MRGRKKRFHGKRWASLRSATTYEIYSNIKLENKYAIVMNGFYHMVYVVNFPK